MAGLASTSQDLAAQHVAQFESFITHATEPGGPLAQLRSIVSCSQQEAASSHHAIRVSGSDISDYDHALGNALMQQPLVMLPRLDEALRVVVLAPRPTATAVQPRARADAHTVSLPRSRIFRLLPAGSRLLVRITRASNASSFATGQAHERAESFQTSYSYAATTLHVL